MSNLPPPLGSWTESDFDSLSWHDCSIHGLRFEHGPEAWESHLILDIDHLAEWIRPTRSDEGFAFKIAPADWIFGAIEDLRIDMGPSLYAGPCSISQVVRKPVTPRPGWTTWRWIIELHAPSAQGDANIPGSIQFLSGAMILRHRKPAIVQGCQVLPREMRL